MGISYTRSSSLSCPMVLLEDRCQVFENEVVGLLSATPFFLSGSGYRRENEKAKQNTMRTYWVPGVNNLKTYGRWAFAEFTEVYGMDEELEDIITKGVDEMIDEVTAVEDPQQPVRLKIDRSSKSEG
ncbi:hypothetical protein N8642_02065 [bacterium]|nr:hypothetical protein [bacterium]